MRAGTRSSTLSLMWFGLAALGAIENLGPRPLFVRTAYAAPAVTEIEDAATSAVDAGTIELTNDIADR